MKNPLDITKFKSFSTVKRNFISKLPKEAFDSKFENSCWLWQGNMHWNGYGRINWGKTERYFAHRISYMIYNGFIPQGKVIRHTCDNPHCINPKHLVMGTQADNLKDMAKRNRHGMSKLNPEAVKVIKWMLKYKNYHGLASKLARLHDVTPYTIHDIKRNKSWAWVKI